LELAAAYEIQEQAFGGLKPEIRKALAVGSPDSIGQKPARRAKNRIIKPGTRLAREWNGRTHHVEAVNGGFLWNGKLGPRRAERAQRGQFSKPGPATLKFT
jgi:hypothetical protein